MKIKHSQLLMRFLAPEDGGKGGSGGGDADLREAITDSEKFKSGEKAKVKSSVDEARATTEDSGILASLESEGHLKIPGDSSELAAMELEQDQKKKKDSEEDKAKEKKTDSQSTDDDLMKDIREKVFTSIEEEPPNASPAIKDKFKRHKEEMKKAADLMLADRRKIAEQEKKIAELEKKGGGDIKVEDTDAYKALLKERNEANEIVDRVSLIDSPRFQEKYVKPLVDQVKKLVPYLNMVESDDKKKALAVAMDQLKDGIPPGDDNDPLFYRGLNKALADSDYDDIRDQVKTIAIKMRESVNERGEAIKNWRETKKALGGIEAQNLAENIKTARAAVDLVRSTFEKQNSTMIEKIVGTNDPYEYRKTIDSVMGRVKDELEATVRSGLPSPFILGVLNQGAEYEVLAKRHNTLLGFAAELQKKLVAAKARLKELGDGDEDGKAGHSKSSRKKGDEGSGFGMLDSVRSAGS